MIQNIYAIRDIKQAYMSIWTSHNDSTATRIFDNTDIPYRADMELWHLGEYDDEKGTIKDNKYIIS